MSRDKNFLLGHGERLTLKVTVPSGGGKKNPPYGFSQARDRISKDLTATASQLAQVPQEACPNDEVVALVTMHPRYISKSDFPEDLFKAVGLRSVGSRSASIKPDNWGTNKHPDGEVVTEQVFVAGKKQAFNQWSSQLAGWNESQKGAMQITHVEKVSPFIAKDKLKSIPTDRDEAVFEVVLHNSGNKSVVDAFEAYALKCGEKPIMDRCREVGGLTFIPVKGPTSKTLQLAQFSFLRVIRGMPTLRPIGVSMLRSQALMDVTLPTEAVLNPEVNAVVFDGGVPENFLLKPWVTSIEPAGIGKPVAGYMDHGIGVTSALLFGPITNPKLPRPFCHVDHVRVLDEDTGKNATDMEILDVLDRIMNHLNTGKKHYHFINMSLGPDLAVNDHEVTQWTATLDEWLSRQDSLATVAVGNNGELDAISGLNRVQVPSDAVNVLAVGACDVAGKKWARASYSGIGPGRRPGIVKPDGMAFGGSTNEPFMVLAPSTKPSAKPNGGTSFAAPFALRTAAGTKSYIGKDINPLAIRALMIHRADSNGHPIKDVGWGRFESDVNQLITCDDNEALVIYQGELPVKEHLRANIPIPSGLTLHGDVEITATLVISPEVDPEHPGAYTRAGLDAAFRPHSGKFAKPKNGKTPKHPQTKSFFSVKNMYGKAEYEFREDGTKWEPCLKNTKKFRASTLKAPCFDIYYHNREGGTANTDPQPIKYALVISVKASKMPDFYNQVVRAYANILVPLQPKIQLQLRS